MHTRARAPSFPVTREPFDLARLLDPLGTDGFFSTYWERQQLLLPRGLPGYYESLITTADLENIISRSDARYPAIRLAKGGGYFAPEVYTHNVKHGDESFLGVPDVKRIAEEYRRGATVALPAIHRTWPALGSLCDQLQTEFGHPAHANVYITPGNAAGFTPHYDIHEVFVLQIAGRKRWSIYAPVIELPHRSQLFTPQAYSGQAPIAEVELTSGDLLYLPRGFLHSTTTSDGFSAHVTVGITVYTWVDLLKEHLRPCSSSREFAICCQRPWLRRFAP
jgi:ribosomal protein L16 Arg81 hydroxylase